MKYTLFLIVLAFLFGSLNATSISSLPYTIISPGTYTISSALSGSGTAGITVSSGISTVTIECTGLGAIDWTGNYSIYLPGSNSYVTIKDCSIITVGAAPSGNTTGIYIVGTASHLNLSSVSVSATGENGVDGADGAIGWVSCTNPGPVCSHGDGGPGINGTSGGNAYGLYGLITDSIIANSVFTAEGGDAGSGGDGGDSVPCCIGADSGMYCSSGGPDGGNGGAAGDSGFAEGIHLLSSSTVTITNSYGKGTFGNVGTPGLSKPGAAGCTVLCSPPVGLSCAGKGGEGAKGSTAQNVSGFSFTSTNFTDSVIDGRRSAATKTATAGSTGSAGGLEVCWPTVPCCNGQCNQYAPSGSNGPNGVNGTGFTCLDSGTTYFLNTLYPTCNFTVGALIRQAWRLNVSTIDYSGGKLFNVNVSLNSTPWWYWAYTGLDGYWYQRPWIVSAIYGAGAATYSQNITGSKSGCWNQTQKTLSSDSTVTLQLSCNQSSCDFQRFFTNGLTYQQTNVTQDNGTATVYFQINKTANLNLATFNLTGQLFTTSKNFSGVTSSTPYRYAYTARGSLASFDYRFDSSNYSAISVPDGVYTGTTPTLATTDSWQFYVIKMNVTSQEVNSTVRWKGIAKLTGGAACANAYFGFYNNSAADFTNLDTWATTAEQDFSHYFSGVNSTDLFNSTKEARLFVRCNYVGSGTQNISSDYFELSATTYPRDIYGFVGSQTQQFFSQANALNGTNSPASVPDFKTRLSTYLWSCTADSAGRCTVPLVIKSSAGGFYLDALNISFCPTCILVSIVQNGTTFSGGQTDGYYITVTESNGTLLYNAITNMTIYYPNATIARFFENQHTNTTGNVLNKWNIKSSDPNGNYNVELFVKRDSTCNSTTNTTTNILTAPSFSVVPSSYTYSIQQNQSVNSTFTLTNTGNANLSVTVISNFTPNTTFFYTPVIVNVGTPNTTTIQFNSTGVPAGSYTATIAFTNNSIDSCDAVGGWVKAFDTGNLAINLTNKIQGAGSFNVTTNYGGSNGYGTIYNLNYNGNWSSWNLTNSSVFSAWVYIENASRMSGVSFGFGDIVSGGSQVCKGKSWSSLKTGWNYLSAPISSFGTSGGYTPNYNNISQLRWTDDYAPGYSGNYTVLYDDLRIGGQAVAYLNINVTSTPTAILHFNQSTVSFSMPPNVFGWYVLNLTNVGSLKAYDVNCSMNLSWMNTTNGLFNITINDGVEVNSTFDTTGVAVGTYYASLNCTDNASDSDLAYYTVTVDGDLIDVNPSSASYSLLPSQFTTNFFSVGNIGSQQANYTQCFSTGTYASWITNLNPDPIGNITVGNSISEFYTVTALSSTPGTYVIPIKCNSSSGSTDYITISVTVTSSGGGGGGGGGGGTTTTTIIEGANVTNIFDISPARIDANGIRIVNEFQGNNYACSLASYTLQNLHPSSPLTISVSFDPPTYLTSDSRTTYNYAQIFYFTDRVGDKISLPIALGSKETKEIIVCVASDKEIIGSLIGKIKFSAVAEDGLTEVENIPFAISERFTIGGFDVFTVILIIALVALVIFVTTRKLPKRGRGEL